MFQFQKGLFVKLNGTLVNLFQISLFQTMEKKKSRAYCFVLHGYSAEEEEAVKAWDCVYLIFGHEIAPTTGSPHLQGYVYWENPRSLSGLKTLNRRINWRPCKGSPEQNVVYCSKDGDDVFEKGIRPLSNIEKGQTEKDRWENAFVAVKENRIEDVDADIKGRFLKSIEYAVQRERVSKRKLVTLDDLQHEWHVGPPGTGKSRTARAENPDAYIKDPTMSWWDGYLDEDVVIIDDFDKFQVKQGGDMKRWLDRYPFQAPIKGGYNLIRPRKIIVTSNYSPQDIWDDQLTVEAINRRVKIIHYPQQGGAGGGGSPPA